MSNRTDCGYGLEICMNNQWYSAWEIFGIRMGDGFLDALNEPLALKDPIVNQCRTQHGVRVTTIDGSYIKDRDLTLGFTIEGENREELQQLRNGFFDHIRRNNGYLTIRVPELGEDVYRLRYKDKVSEYALTLDRRFCAFKMKFAEDNPANRS